MSRHGIRGDIPDGAKFPEEFEKLLWSYVVAGVAERQYGGSLGAGRKFDSYLRFFTNRALGWHCQQRPLKCNNLAFSNNKKDERKRVTEG